MSNIKIKNDVKAYQYASPIIYIHTQSLVVLAMEVYWEEKKKKTQVSC